MTTQESNGGMTDSETKQQADQVAPQPGERAMVIVAHPDDADFVAAGTMARWAREGKEVILVVITDGSKGSDDPNMSPELLVPLREAEQRAAAARLGVAEVVFLGYEDGVLEDTLALRRDLTRVIRRYRPSRAICMDPTMRWSGQGYINHPDHIAGADAALAAIYPLARNRGSFRDLLEEGLEPHKVEHVYVAATGSPDCWIDIADTIDLKVEALRMHASQVDGEQVESMIRAWAKEDGERHGMAYAESFKYFRLG